MPNCQAKGCAESAKGAFVVIRHDDGAPLSNAPLFRFCDKHGDLACLALDAIACQMGCPYHAPILEALNEPAISLESPAV